VICEAYKYAVAMFSKHRHAVKHHACDKSASNTITSVATTCLYVNSVSAAHMAVLNKHI
jgi:hypothetical protein